MSNNLIGATLATFTVTLSAAVNEPVDVAWSTRDGTAEAGYEYEAANGVVTFLPGETAKQVQVRVYGSDDPFAADTNFFIEFAPPTNAVLGVTIIEVVISVSQEGGVAVLSVVMPQGKRGLKGDPGLSAYEHAVLMGYEGTVEQWMDEIADASQAAERANDFASQAAESSVVAGQKANEATEAVGSTKQYVDSALSDLSTAANKFYPTKAEAEADIANIAVSQPVTIGEAVNGGLWYKATTGATSLTKSAYDPLQQAKSYADTNPLFKPKQISVTDLNDLTQEGFYYADTTTAANIANKPEGVVGSMFVLVRKYGASSVITMQEIVDNQLQSFKRRRPNATDWTDWAYYPKQADVQSYIADSIAIKPVANGDDLNNFIQSGTYMTTSNGDILNVPFDVKAAFLLVVYSKYITSTSTVIYQTLIDNNNVEYKRRSFDGGAIWTDWVNSSRTPQPVPNNADLNAYIYNGIYHSSASGVLNAPPQATGAFVLEVIARKPTTSVVVYQSLTNHQDMLFKRRSIDGGLNWSQWKTISNETVILTTSSELDMNKMHLHGVYFGTPGVIGMLLNKPSEVTAAFKIEVQSAQVNSTTKVIYQKITNHLNRTWIRRTANFSVSEMTATWTEWIEEVTTANIANIVAPMIPEIPSDIGVFGSYIKSVGTKLAAYQLPSIADINHFLSYGQSLSIGAGGQPAISLTQYASNLTFAGGPRAASGSYLPLKPLVEDDLTAPDGGANRGETPCAGTANYASFLMLKENGIKPADHVILSTAGGRGGYRISQLNKGTTWYENNMLAHINNAVSYCSDNNLAYSMPLISWAQGEFDQNKTDITREQYADLLEQLQIDMQADIKARSGMQTRIPFVTYQTSWYSRLRNHVALAQLDVVKRSEDFYFSTPMYHLPHASDNLHLNNVGNKLFGCYIGRVYKQLVIDQIHPEFLCPLSAEMQGTKIVIRFHVPKAPLVLDDVNLAATTDHGFKVIDNGGATVAHSTIAVSSDGTKIEIELGAVPTNPIKVRYALDYLGAGLNIDDAASGNLRDSTDDQVSFDGNTYNLWHVCPHFELDVLNLQV